VAIPTPEAERAERSVPNSRASNLKEQRLGFINCVIVNFDMSSGSQNKPEALSASIRALRERLHETQAGMARLLGVSLRTYNRWEAEDASPTGRLLMKILDLCPDEETRALFRSAPGSTGSDAWQIPEEPPRLRYHTAGDRLRLSLRNSCLEAIRTICEAAMLGSAAADEKLRTYACELNRTAAMLAKDLAKQN
jgi:DNA-binding transcriptional regulator YiaG